VGEVDEDKSPARFTRFGNILELCALAIPNGYTGKRPAIVAANHLSRL